MHHEDIKAAIRKRGVTPADIAKHLDVTDQTVSCVIRGVTKSARVAEAIASITGLTVSALWPGVYDTSPRQSVAALLGERPRAARKAA